MIRLLLLLALALPTTLLAQRETAYFRFEQGSSQKLVADNVNVRKAPQPNAEVITKLPIATDITILSQEGNYTMNGVEAPWFKVKFKGSAGFQEGYVWGGLIATAFVRGESGITFLYNPTRFVQSEEDGEDLVLQVRAVQAGKELSRIEVPAVGSMGTRNTLTVLAPTGLPGVKDALEFDFSDEFCGGMFGQTYLFWDGTKLFDVYTTHDGVDAPYSYDEALTFPNQEGGKPGKVIFTASSNEKYAEDENADPNQYDVIDTRTYTWNGKTLVEQ